MKRMPKQEGEGGVRAYVDLSALSPSKSGADPARTKPGPPAKEGRTGEARENEAVREALDGWRWI
jgi:hypothetical protein